MLCLHIKYSEIYAGDDTSEEGYTCRKVECTRVEVLNMIVNYSTVQCVCSVCHLVKYNTIFCSTNSLTFSLFKISVVVV